MKRKIFEVSTDFLLGVTDDPVPSNFHINELGLSVDAAKKIYSGEVDVALIATPHYDHSPIAQYAFSKGVHVLTEKPAGVYTKQVREMNEAAANRANMASEAALHRSNLMSETANLSAHQINVQGDVMKTGLQNMGQMGTVNLGGGDGHMNPAGMMTSMMMGTAVAGQMGQMMGNMGNTINQSMQPQQPQQPTPPPMPGATPPPMPQSMGATPPPMPSVPPMPPRKTAPVAVPGWAVWIWAAGTPPGRFPYRFSVFGIALAFPPM